MSTSSTDLRLAFIGAGAVNFGRPDASWDHASRLEKIAGFEVIGIADPDTVKATEVLHQRKQSKAYGHFYENCKVLDNPFNLIPMKPDAAFIGIPPAYRGSLTKGFDLELRFVQAGIHVFVEKPLSVVPPEEFLPYAGAIDTVCRENNVLVSVGYMFRYHDAVLKMKELIREHGEKVMAFNARYYFPYTEGSRKPWYNAVFNGGPIVEQATHFCDLARFIVGDVDSGSIHTIMLKDTDPSGAGHLAYVPEAAEEDIPPEKRIPRVTLSHWRFKDGGVGTLMHSLVLPGTRYEATIDVQSDGLKLSLIEPYDDHCILRVRSSKWTPPNKDHDLTFRGSDPYREELKTFISAVRLRDQSVIQSSYSDAAKTYDMTWTIRRTGEKS